jgi:hypothetical protein
VKVRVGPPQKSISVVAIWNEVRLIINWRYRELVELLMLFGIVDMSYTFPVLTSDQKEAVFCRVPVPDAGSVNPDIHRTRTLNKGFEFGTVVFASKYFELDLVPLIRRALRVCVRQESKEIARTIIHTIQSL